MRFDTAGKLFDAVKAGQCDVGFLGNEPQRASEVAFTGPYLEIPVTFLVPEGSPIRAIADVDRKRVRIAVSERSAYDLYLSRYLKQAEIVRAPGIAASFDWFVERVGELKNYAMMALAGTALVLLTAWLVWKRLRTKPAAASPGVPDTSSDKGVHEQ